eukprot:8625423-Pyramimonas_sp.AAC.1
MISVSEMLAGGSLAAEPAPPSQSPMVDALASYWGPVFSKTHSVPSIAKEYIDRFSSSEDFSDVRPPVLRDVERALKQSNWSALGPDGLHYAAWRCGSGSR